MKLKLISIDNSDRINKRYKATFNDGTITHFGHDAYENYTIHKNDKRKISYIKRHQNDNLTDPKSAGALSRWILWNKKNLADSILSYKKKFNI